MRVLLLCHAFNGLTQRLLCELEERGHTVSVELDIADAVTEEAVALMRPDVVVASYLRRAIPERVWSAVPCLVVHPGIEGDRGPSALDRAILDEERQWGVTVLQATGEMDAGPVWASRTFAMRKATKSSLYRNEVTDGAVACVMEALEAMGAGRSPRTVRSGEGGVRGRARPLVTQEERAIDWAHDDTRAVLRKIASADGAPGVKDALFGEPCFLYGATAEEGHSSTGAEPGAVIARAAHGGSILRATQGGAVWIDHVRVPGAALPFKRTVEAAFPEAFAALPAASGRACDPIGYAEEDGVGTLRFAFHGGALSTGDCARLREALERAKAGAARVLVLAGGDDHWSNGLHLHAIEAARSPADESMRNIEAIDDLALAILTTDDKWTVAALAGGAGAGGAFLALAADEVWARAGIVINPHYKNMGNLYGSEYWTFSLPRRIGEARAAALVDGRLPMIAAQAERAGLCDAVIEGDLAAFHAAVQARARAIAAEPGFAARLDDKRRRRARDEAARPLAECRARELAEMRRNFYGFDPSYHYARHHFVYKTPLAFTPRHLARHRR